MKCKVKLTQVVICFGLLLCSIPVTVESAPTVENKHEIEPALHVLPLVERGGNADVPLTSVESVDTPIPSHSRNKRAIIFRPLFVYRQQQIKKQRVLNALVPQTGR